MLLPAGDGPALGTGKRRVVRAKMRFALLHMHASPPPFYFGCTMVWGTYMTVSGLTG